MSRLSGAVLLLLFTALSARAQEAAPAAPEAREQELQDMRARIEKLEKLVAELQAEKQASKSVTAQAVEPAVTPAAPISHAAEPAGPVILADHSLDHAGARNSTDRKYPSLHFRGFGDVDFSASDDKTTRSGFNLGQLILHMSSPLSEKVTVFGETSFTAQTTGFNVDLERLLIRYDYNDFFKLSFAATIPPS